MIKIRLLVLVAIVLIGGCLTASAKTTQLTLKLKDGRSIVLDLSASGEGENKKLPVMTFTPTTMKVELPPKEATEPGEIVAPTVYTFEVEDLQAMEPIETDASGIMEIITKEKAIAITPMGGDMVKVTSSKPITGDDVRIYDMAGRGQMVDVVSQGEYELTISLSQLVGGVYIIQVSNYSIKVTKR